MVDKALVLRVAGLLGICLTCAVVANSLGLFRPASTDPHAFTKPSNGSKAVTFKRRPRPASRVGVPLPHKQDGGFLEYVPVETTTALPITTSSTTSPRPPRPNAGFIACVAGGNRKFGFSEASFMGAAVRRLRYLQNNDPVMVFHVGDELTSAEVKALMTLDGVTAKDLLDVLDDEDRAAVKGDVMKYRGFDCKVAALLHSPFEKTMLMDSDTMFFTDPGQLWENPIVLQTGTMFFFDRKTNDKANPSPPGNIKCDSIVSWAADPAVRSALGTKLPDDFRLNHKSFCDGATKHEACSSLVVIDRGHKTGAATMKMLKQLHSKYIMTDEKVGSWSWGDKEYYWVACELTGNTCGYSPRGRPMHLFNFDEQMDKERKMGCSVQVAPDGLGWDLLHGNLDYVCPLMNKMLNAITVWNPKNPEPLVDGDTQSLNSGRGTRMLSDFELYAIFMYWRNIEDLQGFINRN